MRSDTWPFGLLSPKRLSWYFTTTLKRGGRSLSNYEQRDRVDGGPNWGAALRVIPVWSAEQIAAHAVLEAILVGDLDTIVLPRRPPRCENISPLSTGPGVPHSDGTPFSDGTLYQTALTTGVVTAPAELGTVEVSFTILGATRPLWAGEEFTLVHPTAAARCYRVKRILAQAGDDYTVEIHSPLRDDVTVDEVMDFTDPRCLMRLEDLESFRLEFENNQHGEFDATFEEAIW